MIDHTSILEVMRLLYPCLARFLVASCMMTHEDTLTLLSSCEYIYLYIYRCSWTFSFSIAPHSQTYAPAHAQGVFSFMVSSHDPRAVAETLVPCKTRGG
jgi:hypothetical protein